MQDRVRGWGFPGGPVGRTMRFHCRGPGSIPGWEADIQGARRGQKIKNIKGVEKSRFGG